MVAKDFETGDLVWAKMKGFPPWPGKIVTPPPNAKAKKSHHYVLFYGSDNYAWIPDENIFLHNEGLVEKYTKGQKRPPTFLEAVKKITNASKGLSKYQKPKDSETSFEKVTIKKEPCTEAESPQSSSVSKGKRKRKVPLKKTPVIKKEPKKRPLSSDRNGADSNGNEGPSKSMRTDEDFSLLLPFIVTEKDADGPSVSTHNNENESMHQTPALLSRKAYIQRPSSPPINLEKMSEKLKIKNITPTAKTIGFLGLGRIGQEIIKNLLQSGHSVTLWNRTITKCDDFVKIGAKVSKTPYDVVLASDITFCCVADPNAAKHIVFENAGVLKALEVSESKDKSFVQMTSMDPDTSISIGDEVVTKGGRYLEAPLHGSRAQANEGSLFILCAGDKSLYDDCESCFKAIGRSSLYIGPKFGIAYTYNIIHSMLLGTVYAAMAEALALIEHVDMKKTDFLDILQNGILNNAEFVAKSQSMIRVDYATDTPLKHQQKELNFGLILGSLVDQPMPITAAANEVYKHCKLLRYADHDVSAVFEGTL